MWYDEGVRAGFLNQLETGTFESDKNTPPFIYKVQSQLQALGYQVDLSGQWDNQTKLVVQSFQYHFWPQIGMEFWIWELMLLYWHYCKSIHQNSRLKNISFKKYLINIFLIPASERQRWEFFVIDLL